MIYIGSVIERSDQNKDVYIKLVKQNQLILTWPQDLQKESFICLKYNTMVLDSHPSTLTCEAKNTQKAKSVTNQTS